MAAQKRTEAPLVIRRLAFLLLTISLWPLFFRSFSKWDDDLTSDLSIPKFTALGRSAACRTLSASLPDHIYSDPHPAFRRSIKASYAVQAQQEVPTCIVRPTSPQNVSVTVQILRVAYDKGEDARFAIRSGGHFAGRGHSSIQHGVLIDLSPIDEITVAEDGETVTLGVGSRWGSVYQKLNAVGLRVAGGRDAGVGVGGFLLGGGISYFSPRLGMACDDVLEYEVVLANSSVVHVSNSTHSDLFKSLKGGSGNFGIVTRVRMKTFPGGDVWGGYVLSPWSHLSTIVAAFYTYLKRDSFDELGAGPVVSLAYLQNLGIMAIGSSIVHTVPVEWPPSWSDYKKGWGLWSSLKTRSIWDLAQDLHMATRGDKRQVYATLTIENDLDTLMHVSSMMTKYRSRMRSIKGLLMSLALQPLPHADANNVLGLQPQNLSKDMPVLLLLCPSWNLESDDAVVEKIVYDILDEVQNYASKRGVLNSYIYLNYAAYWQDPIASYGEGNRALLQAVSLKYDPAGFWQHAKKGGFKLGLYMRPE